MKNDLKLILMTVSIAVALLIILLLVLSGTDFSGFRIGRNIHIG